MVSCMLKMANIFWEQESDKVLVVRLLRAGQN